MDQETQKVSQESIEEKPEEHSQSVEQTPSQESNLYSKPTQSTAKKESIQKEQGKDNIIFVGIKPFMNYVTGVVMQFQNKGQPEVIVSARGKFISKAVDVVEVARRTFLKDENIRVDNIRISSEQFENKEGKRIFVSAIEIKLVKE